MKKILLAFILLITFLCVGCGETEQPEIELTLENYSEYLKIRTTTGEQTTVDLYGLRMDVGTEYFYTYGIAPGSFKNVELELRLEPVQPGFYDFVTFNGDVEDVLYVPVVLPSDGKYTSEEYTILQTKFSSFALGPSMLFIVESISGTFVPD